MRIENVKTGEAYMLKVGKNVVQVTVKSVDEKGKITVATAAGKTVTVADAGRLAVHREGRASAPDTNAPRAAHGARRKARTPKATNAASGRNVGQQGSPDGKKKRLGLLSEAAAMLKEASQPMNAKEMVEAVLAKGQWATKGKTPEATLYAAIIREIAKKGGDARFVKTERGKFSLKS